MLLAWSFYNTFQEPLKSTEVGLCDYQMPPGGSRHTVVYYDHGSMEASD